MNLIRGCACLLALGAVSTCFALDLMEQAIIDAAAERDQSSHYGHAVAIDGDTAVVGCPLEDNGENTDQGSAFVYVRNGTTWTRQARLTASDGAFANQFGFSVAIDGDT